MQEYKTQIITAIICAVFAYFAIWALVMHFFKKDIDYNRAKRLYIKGKCNKYIHDHTRYTNGSYFDGEIIYCNCGTCKYCKS